MRFNSYTRYYNGNMYDVHRRSVWIFQGLINYGGGYKRTRHGGCPR